MLRFHECALLKLQRSFSPLTGHGSAAAQPPAGRGAKEVELTTTRWHHKLHIWSETLTTYACADRLWLGLLGAGSGRSAQTVLVRRSKASWWSQSCRLPSKPPKYSELTTDPHNSGARNLKNPPSSEQMDAVPNDAKGSTGSGKCDGERRGPFPGLHAEGKVCRILIISENSENLPAPLEASKSKRSTTGIVSPLPPSPPTTSDRKDHSLSQAPMMAQGCEPLRLPWDKQGSCNHGSTAAAPCRWQGLGWMAAHSNFSSGVLLPSLRGAVMRM